MHTIPNCFYRISIKGLILDKEKRFLLVQEENGKRELPGGGLDWGENVQGGLEREMREEMGLTITSIAEHPSYFITWQEEGVWRANILFLITTKDLVFTPSEECIDIGFFTKETAQDLDVFLNVTEFLRLFDPKH